MSDKIAPCPWCGKYAAPARSWASYVQCLDIRCEASGPIGSTLEAAIAAWNEVSGLRAEVERLKADIATAKDLYTATCNASSNPLGVGFPDRGT